MDSGKELSPAQSVKPDNHSAGTVTGAGVDMKGFGEALVILDSGANGSSGTLDVHVEESDDNSTFVDITGAAFTQVTEANDNAMYAGRIRMTPTRKRYLRAIAVVATAACDAAVSIVRGDAECLPAATPAFDIHN